ncbi:MAG TPA: YdcF family protein [Terriglobales bacterium]|nr:YdcF family protein [Terriglobales bacterium]
MGLLQSLVARKGKLIWLFLLILFVGYVGWNFVQVARQSTVNESRPADAIVVFGAAEYAGKPSPVYRARLEHGLVLYKQGLAKFVITTGGPGDDEHFTEGGVGRDYLMAAGIPSAQLIAETQSSDTSDSAERVATIMRANHLRSCLAVSDGYHIHRIKLMMAEQGITAYGTPRPLAKPLDTKARVTYFLREVLSLTLWRLHLK